MNRTRRNDLRRPQLRSASGLRLLNVVKASPGGRWIGTDVELATAANLGPVMVWNTLVSLMGAGLVGASREGRTLVVIVTTKGKRVPR